MDAGSIVLAVVGGVVGFAEGAAPDCVGDEGEGEAGLEKMAVVGVGVADCDAIGEAREEARMILLLRLGKMRLAGMLFSTVSKGFVVEGWNAKCGTPTVVAAGKAEVAVEEEGEEASELA